MMSATIDTQPRLEELLAQPWSREVVADEDGVFIASVPELEGCFADGDTAADAVPATRSSIGALKGIATFFRDRGDINAASLLFAFAADRIATTESAEAASNDLGVTAAMARRHGRSHLAEALWRESLRRNPSNLRSSSTLGQLLHHQGRYREAASYLELPSGIDNYALLFLG